MSVGLRARPQHDLYHKAKEDRRMSGIMEVDGCTDGRIGKYTVAVCII
jgi:hypothetical protein